MISYTNLSPKDATAGNTPFLHDLRMDLAKHLSKKFSLSELPNLVADRKDEISDILRNDKSWRKSVLNVIIKEIKVAADGNLALPHYVPSAKSKQELFVYEGTHWSKLDFDIYIDIVKECALRIGLPYDIATDTAFMNKLYEDLAHDLHLTFKNKVPEGVVWINLLNGTLRILRDGKIRLDNHRRDDYLMYVIPYNYDPYATCPQFLKFLNEVLPSTSTQQVVQEFCGYCFTSNVKAEKMLVLKGNGSNGKSVLMSILIHLFGDENVSQSELSSVTTDAERRSLLENKLVNISSESNKELDPAVLKKMVSGEQVDIRQLYKGSRPMTAIPKFITSYNVMPKPEQTNAFFRRWILVPFLQTFTGKNADKDLDKKLMTELPGILNWALEGLNRFVANGYNFTVSEECENELDKFRKSGDSVAMFVDDRCEAYNGKSTIGSELYEAYKFYCLEDGVRVLGKKTFFDRLETGMNIKRSDPSNIPHFDVTLKGKYR